MQNDVSINYNRLSWGDITPHSVDLYEHEIIMYVKQDAIQAPAGAKSLSLESVTMSENMRNVLTSYNAESMTRPYPDYNPADTIAYSPKGKIVKKLDLSRIYRVRFPDGTELDSVVKDLNALDEVIFAERIPMIKLLAIPNDEFFGYQWGLHNTGQAGGTPGEDIHAVEAWDIFKGSSHVLIGIIDCGVKSDHEDLAGKVSGDPYYYGAHGTHVAGIASAKTNNSLGVAGTDWNANIYTEGLEVDAYGTFVEPADSFYTAIVRAVDVGCDVLNNSWGGSRYSRIIRWAFHYAYEMDRVPVAAMGNTGKENLLFPAGFTCVLAVGATQNNGIRSNFSTYGDHIDVVAPGGTNPYPNNDDRDILSTWTANDFQGKPYRYLSGTSMATPFVTGLAALLKGFRPDLTNDDIMWLIRISADDKPPTGWDKYTGYGRINAERALKYAKLPYQVEHHTASGGTDYSATDWYIMDFPMRPLPHGMYWIVKRHEVRKTVNLPHSDYIELWIWGRKETVGWSKGDPTSPPCQWEEGWCEPVSISGNTVTLRTYVYEVRIVDIIDGEVSEVVWQPAKPSDVVFEYTVFGRRPIYAPSNLQAFVDESFVKLSWQDNSFNEEKFEIYRNSQLIAVVNDNVTSYVDNAVSLGNEYQYRVRAIAGDYFSNFSNSVVVEIKLNPPTSLTAFPLSYSEVKLEWCDNSKKNTGYEIWYKPAGGEWQVDTVSDTTCAIVDNLDYHKEYYFKVRAIDDKGHASAFSDSVKCQPNYFYPVNDLKAHQIVERILKIEWDYDKNPFLIVRKYNSSKFLNFSLDTKIIKLKFMMG